MNIQSWQKTSTVKVSLTVISQMQWKDLVVKINFTSCKPFKMQFAIKKKRNKHVHYFLAGERKILTRKKKTIKYSIKFNLRRQIKIVTSSSWTTSSSCLENKSGHLKRRTRHVCAEGYWCDIFTEDQFP